MLTTTFLCDDLRDVKEKPTVNVAIPVRQSEQIDDLCDSTGLTKRSLLEAIIRRGLPLVHREIKPLLEMKKGEA